MRFTHSLQSSSVSEWTDHYLKYSALKKSLHALERARWNKEHLEQERVKAKEATIAQQREQQQEIDLESSIATQQGSIPASLPPSPRPSLEELSAARAQVATLENAFHDMFSSDLKSTSDFYISKRAEVMQEVAGIRQTDAIDSGSIPHKPIRTSSSSEVTKDQTGASDAPMSPASIDLSQVAHAHALLSDLSDFVEVNWYGYNKLLSKYSAMQATDQASVTALRRILDLCPFGKKEDLTQALNLTEEIWARHWMREHPGLRREQAMHELMGKRRDRLGYEREFLFKQQGQARNNSGSSGSTPAYQQQQPTEDTFATKEGRHHHSHGDGKKGGHGHGHHAPPSLLKQSLVILACALIIVGFVWFEPIPEAAQSDEATLHGKAEVWDAKKLSQSRACINGAAALLFSTILLWMFEPIPLYITAFYIPFMAVCLKVLPPWTLHTKFPEKATDADKEAIIATEMTKAILHHFFSQNILILLAGFAMSSALGKFGVTTGLASSLLSRSSKKPKWIVLIFMTMAVVASAVISNVAASVLCFGLLKPILHESTPDDPFAKALILSIAYAANIGGLTSHIASAQSVVGSSGLYAPGISFGGWFVYSVPVSIVSILVCWMVLLFVFPLPNKDIVLAEDDEGTTSKKHHVNRSKKIFVTVIACLTMLLFVVSKSLERWIGQMGLLAFIPLAFYFGAGVLGKEDYNGFMWNVPTLAMGGSAIGFCVEKSGLLKVIGESFSSMLQGKSHYFMTAVFTFFTLIATTFISHTVGAIILIPIIKAIASKTLFDGKYATTTLVNQMILATCFTTSAGMGLPISGFPNINAVAQEDKHGRPFTTTKDFLKSGLLCSILVWVVIYGLYLVCTGLIFKDLYSSTPIKIEPSGG